jgi:2'-5' RNA ligase
MPRFRFAVQAAALSLAASLALPTTVAFAEGTYPLAAEVQNTTYMPFVRHESSAPFGSYLSMNIPYAPVLGLHDDVKGVAGLDLITRGEAHITVVTPPEYDGALKSYLSIKKIHDLAERLEIQETPFKVVCLGKGEKVEGTKTLTTYFIVVKSPELLKIRREIRDAFVKAGGDPKAFVPEEFYPHITVGFTDRDLHREDGVVKDDRSCTANLELH